MKVTVMSAEVAGAANMTTFLPGQATYYVASPDGFYGFTSFEAAKRFAQSYNLPISYL